MLRLKIIGHAGNSDCFCYTLLSTVGKFHNSPICDEGQNQAESFLTCHQNMPIKKVQMIPKNSV